MKDGHASDCFMPGCGIDGHFAPGCAGPLLAPTEPAPAVVRAALAAPGLVVSFFAPGVPATKGSTRSFVSPAGKLVTKNDNPRGKPWQGVVAVAAMQAGVRQGDPDASVEVRMTFFLERPRGHFRSGGTLKGAAPRAPAKKPDIDKLVRCVLDALTGIAYADDARVTALVARKAWTDDPGTNGQQGVLVVIGPGVTQ